MKKLLNNEKEFNEFVESINSSYVIIKDEEEKPKNYPCIVSYITTFDGYSSDLIYYGFIYKEDFEL